MVPPSPLPSHPLFSHLLSTFRQKVLNRKAQSQRCANYLLLLTWGRRQECARMKLFWSPLIFLSLDGSPMGPIVGKSSRPNLCLCGFGFFFFEDPPHCPIKVQSLRHGLKPSPAGQRCAFESREITLLRVTLVTGSLSHKYSSVALSIS